MVSEYCNARHIIMGRHSRHRKNEHRQILRRIFTCYQNQFTGTGTTNYIIEKNLVLLKEKRHYQYISMNFFIIEYGSNRFVVYKFCCCLNNLVFVVFNNLVVAVVENLLGVYKQPQ